MPPAAAVPPAAAADRRPPRARRHDPRNFALCSGTLEEGVEVLFVSRTYGLLPRSRLLPLASRLQVLFVSADNEADAALWVSAIAGRLYTNELRIDEDLVVEYIAIFQHFDVDANQRISICLLYTSPSPRD